MNIVVPTRHRAQPRPAVNQAATGTAAGAPSGDVPHRSGPGGTPVRRTPRTRAAVALLAATVVVDVVLLPEFLTERLAVGDGLALLCLLSAATAWALWQEPQGRRWALAATAALAHLPLLAAAWVNRLSGVPDGFRVAAVALVTLNAGVVVLSIGARRAHRSVGRPRRRRTAS